jgi:hypothetical protein
VLAFVGLRVAVVISHVRRHYISGRLLA